MAKRDWFDDYMDYKLSGCEDDPAPVETNGGFSQVAAVLLILWGIVEIWSLFS